MKDLITNVFKKIYPDFIWNLPTDEKVIYLTFDDGPVPEITDFVLAYLKKYNAEATFFCVGENVKKYPELAQKVYQDGHVLANHTFNHLNGWKTSTKLYLENVKVGAKELNKITKNCTLFRPPYGRIKKTQATEILKSNKIIMWSVLTRDYKNEMNEKLCLKRAIRKTKSGSIVLFHDSLKASKNLFYVLPRYLKHFSDLGFSFKKIEL